MDTSKLNAQIAELNGFVRQIEKEANDEKEVLETDREKEGAALLHDFTCVVEIIDTLIIDLIEGYFEYNVFRANTPQEQIELITDYLRSAVKAYILRDYILQCAPLVERLDDYLRKE